MCLWGECSYEVLCWCFVALPQAFNVWTHPSLHVFVYAPVRESSCCCTVPVISNLYFDFDVFHVRIQTMLRFFLLYYMLKKIKKLVIAGDQWFWLWFLHITSYQEKQPDMAIRPYESRATSSFQRIPDDHTKSLFWKMLAKRFLKVEGFSTCGKQESSTLNMKIEGQILWFTSAYLCIETEERFSQEAKEWKKNIVFWREGAKK